MSIVAYTEETFAQAVYESMRMRGMDVGASVIPRIRTVIQTAFELLGERVKDGPEYRRMQKDFEVTPVAGVIDLSALTGIVYDHAKASVRVSATNAYLEPVDDLLTLQNGDLPAGTDYYAQDGRTLRVRNSAGSLTAYVTPVKVRANYKPSLTDAARPLPDYFEGAAIETTIGLVGASPVAEEVAA
jgi:hypothetical protein